MKKKTLETVLTLTDQHHSEMSMDFDFSMLKTPGLAESCVSYYKRKHAQGVSLQYLRALMIAFIHYDQYLTQKGLTNPLHFDDVLKRDYESYLEKQPHQKTGAKLKEKYILFLLSVPGNLCNTLNESSIQG